MRPVKSLQHAPSAKAPTSFMRKAIMLPLCAALAAVPAYAGTPTIAALSDITLYIGAPASLVAPDFSVSGGDSYTDGSITFSLAGATANDILGISSDADPDASGAISVSGSDVFVGTGSGRTRIGSIDPVLNGEAGADLKILFSSPLTNSSFEDGTTAGWTEFAQAYPNEADLDGDSITWVQSSDSTTGTQNINIADSSSVTYAISVVTTPVSSGTYALQLSSNGTVTCSDGGPGNYCSVHGPYLESSSFEAFSGDQIFLDWSAVGGSDWYEALGYLIGDGADDTFGTGDDTEILLFSQRGDTKEFSTETANVSTTDTYRFRFVSGSYDFSGGTALGASLYVDNVRVVRGATLSDSVATSIARHVTLQNTSENPPASRVLTISIATEDDSTDSATTNVIFEEPLENLTSKNSGGSSTFGLLAALSLLALRRFKVAAKGAVMMLAGVTLSSISTPGHTQESLLDKLSVTAQGMQVNAGEASDRFKYQANTAGLAGNIKTGDDDRQGWGIKGNFALTDTWQVSAGYLDLGDADTSVTSDIRDIDAFLSSTDNIRMQTGSGATLEGAYVKKLNDKWSATANVGVFAWKADMDFDSTSNQRKVSESDRDYFFGAGFGYRVISPLTIGFGWQRYRLDASDIDAFVLSTTYHLGK